MRARSEQASPTGRRRKLLARNITRAAVETLERRELLTATILGRYTVYGGSALETGGGVPAAIAPDKAPLLPGQTASFANYTSYSRGVNEIAIDVANLPAVNPSAADFVLRAGNSPNPATWATVTSGVTYAVQRGAGTGSSDRILIRLPDGAVMNGWLQVTVNANADTGLSSPDVFYFGNQVGDDGHQLTSAVVDASDEAGARGDLHTFLNPAPPTDLYDFNRDGKVDATDQLIARYAVNTPVTALQYFTAPAQTDPGTSGFTSVYNVKSFGAKGDGISDDTAAIQAAADALKAAGQGLLYFPTGTFRISSFVNLQGMSNFEVRGFGATLMPLNTDSVTLTTGDILRLSNSSNFTVSGLSFNANAVNRGHNTNPASLRVQGCFNFRVSACTFTDPAGDDLYLAAVNKADDATSTHDGIVEGCSFASAYRNAISVIHAQRLSLQGNTIQNVSGTAPQSGIDVEADSTDSLGANHDINITGNRLSNIANYGVSVIKTQGPYAVAVYSNSFANTPSAVFNEGVGTRVDNNVFHDTANPSGITRSAAQVYSATVNGQTVEISGNTFYNLTDLSGVVLDQTWTGHATVSANRFSGIVGGGYGPIATWADGASILGNSIQSPPGVGINVMASNADVELNTLANGASDAIYTEGNSQTVRNNNISGFPVAIDVRNPATGAAGVTVIDSNTVSNCPTAVMDVVSNSRVSNNVFSAATKPVSGPASTALGEIYLFGISGGTAQITGNTVNGLSGLASLYVHPTWSGQLTVSANQISNLSGTGVDAMDISAAGAVVTNNTLSNVAVSGISILADGADVEGNNIPTGPGAGISVSGNGTTLRNNTISGRQYGVFLSGTTPTTAYTVVDSNSITNCPTGVWDTVGRSYVTNNSFSNAGKPASGPGSDATAQVFVYGTGSAFAQVSGNTFSGLTNLGAVNVQGGAGQTTVTANQISNVSGSGFNVINLTTSNAAVTNNTITGTPAVGIAVVGDGNTVSGNSIPAGTFTGIYVEGNGNGVQGNSVTGRQYGIFLATPAVSNPALVTTVNANTISGCITGVYDTLVKSAVTSNTFSSATKPASGTGSDAVGVVTLAGASAASAQVTGNTFDTLNGMAAVYVTSSWTGVPTISNNHISNLSGSNYDAIVIFSNGATVTSNSFQNISSIGICVIASGADIENNSLTGGTNVGIYAEGGNHTIRNNTLVDYGAPLNGQCIMTLYGTGNDVITGNTIRKTVPNPAWVPIVINPLDKPGVNYRYGVQGLDGAFTITVGAATPATSGATVDATGGTVASSGGTGVADTSVTTRVRHGRKQRG